MNPIKGNLSGTVKVTKNADPEKCGYSSYGIKLDAYASFSRSKGVWGKNVVSFGADHSSSVHADNRKTDTLIIGESPT